MVQQTSNNISSVGVYDEYVNGVNMWIYEELPGVPSSIGQDRGEWMNNLQLQALTSPPSFDSIATEDDFMHYYERVATVRYDAQDGLHTPTFDEQQTSSNIFAHHNIEGAESSSFEEALTIVYSNIQEGPRASPNITIKHNISEMNDVSTPPCIDRSLSNKSVVKESSHHDDPDRSPRQDLNIDRLISTSPIKPSSNNNAS